MPPGYSDIFALSCLIRKTVITVVIFEGETEEARFRFYAVPEQIACTCRRYVSEAPEAEITVICTLSCFKYEVGSAVRVFVAKGGQ